MKNIIQMFFDPLNKLGVVFTVNIPGFGKRKITAVIGMFGENLSTP